jgi:hypothetical protein
MLRLPGTAFTHSAFAVLSEPAIVLGVFHPALAVLLTLIGVVAVARFLLGHFAFLLLRSVLG